MGEDACVCSWRVQEAYALSDIHLTALYSYLLSQGPDTIRLHSAWNGGAHSDIYNWQGLQFPGTMGPVSSVPDIENITISIARAYTGFPGPSSYLYSAIEHVEALVYEGEGQDRRVYVDYRGEELTLPIALLHLFNDKCSPQTICAAFLNRLFSDSLLLPLYESIRYCEAKNFPRVKEVKGITNAVIAHALGASGGNTATAIPASSTGQLIPVNVPPALWAGKTAEVVYAALDGQGFAPAVIAFIIMEKVGGITKTNAGRLFCQDEIAKGVIQENRTYQRKIDSLLPDAKSKYLFTFND